MSTRILTLFGDEITPEPPKPAAKTRAKKSAATPSEVPPEPTAPPQETVLVPPVKEKALKLEKEAAPNKEIAPNLADDWQGDKTYYTIGEVAEFFKVKTSHIRFWTNEFKLKVRTTRKGDRLFTPEQVKELRAIYHLVKERGFTLTGAKTKLKAQNKHDVETVDLKTSLILLKNKLVILRDQLS